MPTGIGVGIAGRVFKLTPGGGPTPVVSYNCTGGVCSDPGTGLGQYTSLAACQANCSSVNQFSFSVQTQETGTSNNNQFQLPLVSAGAINMIVDWGDGTTDTITSYNQAETLHTYSPKGLYNIKITNPVLGWKFSGGADCLKMKLISNWGEFNFTTDFVFSGCSNMEGTATDTPVISTTNLEKTFLNCFLWNGVMDSWDVSSVTNMDTLLGGAQEFNQPLNSWDVSNVTDMGNMFQQCFKFNQPLNSWDTSSVLSMVSMFKSCSVFNQPLNSFDTSSVTSMASMFDQCLLFDQPLNSWDVSNVISMASMFSNAQVFNQNIDAWTTTSLTTINSMFNSSILFNQPLNSWDTSSVTSMIGTFNSCSVFNQPLNYWDTSLVTSMESMFNNCTQFNQSLCSFKITSLTPSSSSLDNFAKSSGIDRVNYNNTLISWGITNFAATPGGLSVAFPSDYTNNSSVYAAGSHTVLQSVLTPGWTISDGGGNTSAFDNTFSTHFDGIDDFLLAASTPLLGGGTGNFSISWWFKVDALTGANQRMLSFAQSGTGSQFFLGINTSNKLALTGPYTDTNAGFGVLSADTWYNVIYRIDRAGGTNNVGWVVDGTNFDNKTETGIATFVGDGTTRFGKKGGAAQPFGGNMCDVAIWDKYLTDAECLEIYNSGSPNNLQTTSMSANLDYWWRLGENGGPCIFPFQSNVQGFSSILTMTNMVSTNIEKDTP